jgi:hypothetical protein
VGAEVIAFGVALLVALAGVWLLAFTANKYHGHWFCVPLGITSFALGFYFAGVVFRVLQ